MNITDFIPISLLRRYAIITNVVDPESSDESIISYFDGVEEKYKIRRDLMQLNQIDLNEFNKEFETCIQKKENGEDVNLIPTYLKSLSRSYLVKSKTPENKKKIKQLNWVYGLLSEEKKKWKNLGCGLHNNKYYFGIVLENGKERYNALVTSDRKIYLEKNKENNTIRDEFDLHYRFSLFDDAIDYMWSNESIKNWIEGRESKENIKDLFEEIKQLNEYYIDHVDEEAHTYVALDIISNYFYQLFEAKGRTYFLAEYGSGKSKQSIIYKLLSFNPVMAGNITPASFERIIESTGGTIIVDNFDNQNDDLKKAILQVIEVYYKKGGKTIKSDGQNNRPIAYEGYSPLVINNIVGLSEVTESRCNKIQMLRTENSGLSKRRINETDKKWQNLRDRLHICALQNWGKVFEIYNNLEVSEMSNRDFEKAEAVLTIAKIVGDDAFNKLIKYLTQINEQQKIRELEGNWEFTLFQVLWDLFQDKEMKIVKVKDITNEASKVIDLVDKSDKIRFSHYCGRVLSSYSHLFRKTYSNGNVAYDIKKIHLIKIIKIKNYDNPLGLETDEPHQTTPTALNNTILTKQHQTVGGDGVVDVIDLGGDNNVGY